MRFRFAIRDLLWLSALATDFDPLRPIRYNYGY